MKIEARTDCQYNVCVFARSLPLHPGALLLALRTWAIAGEHRTARYCCQELHISPKQTSCCGQPRRSDVACNLVVLGKLMFSRSCVCVSVCHGDIREWRRFRAWCCWCCSQADHSLQHEQVHKYRDRLYCNLCKHYLYLALVTCMLCIHVRHTL